MGKIILNGKEYTGGGDSQHTYSTDEHIIGTWIDGKPVYERVFDLGSRITCNSNSWTSTNISNTNIRGIIFANAVDLNQANKITIWNMIGVNCDTGSYVQIFNTRSSAIGVTHLILRYLKTTD